MNTTLLGGDDEHVGGEYNEYAEFQADEVAPEFNVKDSILFVIDARKVMTAASPSGGASKSSIP